MLRATRDNLRVAGRTHLAAIRAVAPVAWHGLHAVAAGPRRPAAYRAALDAWQRARSELDRALVPVPPLGPPTPPLGTPHAPQRARTG